MKKLLKYFKADSDPSLGKNPLDIFQKWFKEAKRTSLKQPEAMTLATIDIQGKPNARTVLLKGIVRGHFTFFTNYDSNKGRELKKNPHAALVFFWEPLNKQVRIIGKVKKLSRKESESYFKTRPRESQLGAWASQQSSSISSRSDLLNAFRDYEELFHGQEVPCPPYWGGLALDPTQMEFWIGQTGRLHDRFQYVRGRKGWKITRLCP